MSDPVYAVGFIDDDATLTESRMQTISSAMDDILHEHPGARWRDTPRIERVGTKVMIRARLEWIMP